MFIDILFMHLILWYYIFLLTVIFNMLIPGTLIADNIKKSVQTKWEEVKKDIPPPSLAIIQVGSDKASSIYVANKIKACKAMGFFAEHYLFPENSGKNKLLDKIKNLNEDPKTSAILLQLPLPKHIDTLELLSAISPDKDVDVISPYNAGKISLGNANLIPCTAKAVLHILRYISYPIAGKNIAIIGDSVIVGRPCALTLLNEHASVSICHKMTDNLEKYISKADILIVAIGKPNIIKTSWIKKDSIVIDVGINKNEYGKLCGDINTSSAQKIAKAITPVPGGVGPVTVACLLENLLQLHLQQNI